MRRARKLGLSVVIFALFCFVRGVLSGEPAAASKPAPSANKGKTGKYQCSTSHAGYDYWVGVPSTYSEDNPAGLLVFFHGQGCPNTARSLIDDFWMRDFLEPYNLIAVCMQYQDGDNMKDTAGKVAAAREAIAQTFADYKIIPGRGLISSFSGGGVTQGLFFKQSAKKRGPEWPFCHSAQYSSNFHENAPGASPTMGWFFSVGTAEWSLAGLGKTATGHMVQLLTAAAKGGVMDLRLKVLKGKGHEIREEEVQENARMFRRSDLAFAPFIYEPDYPEKELAPLAQQANTLALGPPATALDRLISNKTTAEGVHKKAEALRQKITSRAAAILQVMKDFAADDALLCNYYNPIFTAQLNGLPEAKELQQLISKSTALKDLPRIQPLYATFKDQFKGLFGGDGNITAAAVPYLEQVQKAAGPKSQFGGMADEFLQLK